jgi:hypothetical protein
MEYLKICVIDAIRQAYVHAKRVYAQHPYASRHERIGFFVTSLRSALCGVPYKEMPVQTFNEIKQSLVHTGTWEDLGKFNTNRYYHTAGGVNIKKLAERAVREAKTDFDIIEDEMESLREAIAEMRLQNKRMDVINDESCRIVTGLSEIADKLEE